MDSDEHKQVHAPAVAPAASSSQVRRAATSVQCCMRSVRWRDSSAAVRQELSITHDCCYVCVHAYQATARMEVESSGSDLSLKHSENPGTAATADQSCDSKGRFLCQLCQPVPAYIRSDERARKHKDQWAHDACVKRVLRAAGALPRRQSSALPPPAATLTAAAEQMTLRSATAATEDEIRTKTTMRSHHWSVNYSSRMPGVPDLAAQWVRFGNSPNLSAQWMDLHGGGETIELASTQLRGSTELLNQTEHLARTLMREVNIMDSLYRVVDPAAIHADEGHGEQDIHFDQTEKERAERCITFLFYCTEGLSAALPMQCHSYTQQSFLAVPCEATPTLAESAQAARVASAITYRPFAFHPGDSLLFFQDVPHKGKAALPGGEKLCIYLKFERISEPRTQPGAHGKVYLRLPTMGAPDYSPTSTAPAAAPSSSAASSGGSASGHNFVVPSEKLAAIGLGVTGLQRPAAANALSLLHIEDEMHRGASLAAAVRHVASVEKTSPRTLQIAVQTLLSIGDIRAPDSSLRGRGSPAHPLSPHNVFECPSGPSLAAELLMHSLVKQTAEGGNVTSVQLAAELRSQLGLNVTSRTVQRWLHALGYHWRKKRYVGGVKPAARSARIRQFIIEYAEALAEEQAGRAVIVYTDESFIHQHHSCQLGWVRVGDPSVVGDSDGKRLILLHAMTDSGLLAVPEAAGTNWMSEVAETCEVAFEEVYEDGQDDSDYHNTMNGAKFNAWLQNRLLPTFAALYPGKKMILVMDNASYHKARDESWVSSSKQQTKAELADILIGQDVTHLLTKDGRRVESHLFNSSHCTKDDLQAAINTWLNQHPDWNQYIPEQLLSDKGHRIIYTPPFCPEVQPIELLWAFVKNRVAARATLNRSMTESREQTEEAFEAVTAMQCNNIVRHCHDWMDKWLQTEEAGDLQQCGSLAGVIKNLKLIKLATQMQAQQHDDAVSMQIDDPPPPGVKLAPSPIRSLRPRH